MNKILVEWLVTENCNFSCEYCALYNSSKPNRELNKTESFLKEIKVKQRIFDFTLFVFGGEPFLHPNFKEIVQMMNDLGIDYVIQTNLSNKSVERMKHIIQNGTAIQKINISVHPTQQQCEDYIRCIQTVAELNVPIEVIDVMFDGLHAVTDYRRIRISIPHYLKEKTFLVPVSDFYTTGFADAVRLYNSIINDDDYSDILFEIEYITHPLTQTSTERRIVWQEFVDEVWSPKGKPCMYNNKYFLYDTNLNEYNCCFKEKHDGTCNHDQCFIM